MGTKRLSSNTKQTLRTRCDRPGYNQSFTLQKSSLDIAASELQPHAHFSYFDDRILIQYNFPDSVLLPSLLDNVLHHHKNYLLTGHGPAKISRLLGPVV